MTTTAQTWTERKQALKKEICNYFLNFGATKENLIKACSKIKEYGEIKGEVALYFDEKIDPTLPSDEEVERNFSPRHRSLVAGWINQYAQLHLEALQHLKSQREAAREECWGRDDFEYADWEAAQPKGEIIVQGDCITLIAFEYIEGFAPKLPGKKRIGQLSNGGYKWEYPVNQLEALKSKKLHLPVLYSIEVEH